MTENKEHIVPPKWPLKLLRFFIKEKFLEEIEGDMEERFEDNLDHFSERKAKGLYIRDSLKLLRYTLLKKPKFFCKINHYAMFKHNLMLSFRNFKRYKTSFFINLIGLSTGLACTLLIYLWVSDELGVDKFYSNDDHLYQVLQNLQEDEKVTAVYTPGILANALTNEIPEIKTATSVIPPSWFDNKGIISFNSNHVKANGQYVDPNYFDVFITQNYEGEKINGLKNESSVIISKNLALKLFDNIEDAIGKTVEWRQGGINRLFLIDGVCQNMPSNATTQFDLLIDIDVFYEKHDWLTNWENSDPSTFVLLEQHTNVEALNAKIHDFIKTKDPQITDATLLLQKYSDRYLNGKYENGKPVGGRIDYVRLFSLVAIFILIIACINFITLSTAQASRRLKEVGIKKAIGANRKELIFQFLNESILLTSFSFLLACLMVFFALPHFNEIMGKQLSLSFDLNLILTGTIILLTTGLVSGSYPAFYLSGFNPIKALKGQRGLASNTISKLFMRKGLVIVQFTISVFLIISVVVVHSQMNFIQSKNLGYDRDNILYFTVPELNKLNDNSGKEPMDKIIPFMREINQFPEILSSTSFSHNLTGDHGEFWGVDWKEGDDDRKVHFKNLEVGYDFVKTFSIDMLEGRSFSREFSNEKSNILINQKAAEIMGLKEPVGKTIVFWGQKKHIVGITQNFHFESFYEHVKPCIIQLASSQNIAVKLRAKSETHSIAFLKASFDKHFPGYSFDYRFVDQDYEKLYKSEQRVASLSRYFALMAIIISCLGLFGLTSFSIARRTKEIGIRKVLGASILSLIHLLSNDLNRIVVVALVIALPLSFVIANNWLSNFAYKIELNWWIFVISGCITFLIAWLVISWQTIKVTLSNPVHSLKEE